MNKDLLKKMKVLFVEDDETQRNELNMFLKRRVEKVYTAKNGEEGFEKYKTMKPDIVLTDLRMPKMDGLELVKLIREMDRLIPIIIITAMNDKETILKSVEVGITNYVIKPIDTNELLEILEDSVKTIMEIKSDEFENIVDKDKLNNLKNRLTKYIKIETGKGPSDVRIKMAFSSCEITFIDCLTLYEKNLIEKGRHLQLVNHNRNIFFQDRRSELERIISQELSLNLAYKETKTDAQQNEAKVIFMLK